MEWRLDKGEVSKAFDLCERSCNFEGVLSGAEFGYSGCAGE